MKLLWGEKLSPLSCLVFVKMNLSSSTDYFSQSRKALCIDNSFPCALISSFGTSKYSYINSTTRRCRSDHGMPITCGGELSLASRKRILRPFSGKAGRLGARAGHLLDVVLACILSSFHASGWAEVRWQSWNCCKPYYAYTIRLYSNNRC